MPIPLCRMVPALYCALATGAASHAGELPVRWTITELTYPGAFMAPMSINDAGVISGLAYIPEDTYTTRHPFIHSDGVTHLLGTPSDSIDVFGINEASLDVAFDSVTRTFYHVTIDGMTELGAIGGSFEEYFFIQPPNASGAIAGYYRIDSNNHRAFTWNDQEGLVYLAEERSNAGAMSINDSGAVAGYAYNQWDDPEEPLCFIYQDGVRTDFEHLVPGRNAVSSINDRGEVLVQSYDPDNAYYRGYYLMDSSDFSSTVIAEYPHPSYDGGVILNNEGQAAVVSTKDINGDWPATLHIWSADGGIVPLELPDDSDLVFLSHFTDAGIAIGSSLDDVNYDTQAFMTSADHGMLILNERIIGLDSSYLSAVASLDTNASHQFVGRFYLQDGGDSGYVVLSPARPGDVNGDGQVDTDDVLALLSAWGDWPAGSTCGPDLNMDGYVNVDDLLLCINDWN